MLSNEPDIEYPGTRYLAIVAALEMEVSAQPVSALCRFSCDRVYI